MGTTISSNGVLISRKNDYMFTVRDLCLSMGYPVTEAPQAACGATCQYSDNAEAPASRSFLNQCHQVGNAMRVNCVGA